MKLLLDVNIVLDAILSRQPWAGEAALLLSEVEKGAAEGHVVAHTITTIYYIIAKERGRRIAATAISDLLRVVRVVPLGDSDFQQALVLELDDFEDAVQAAAAVQVGASYIVTRNPRHFQGLSIPPRSAGEIVALL